MGDKLNIYIYHRACKLQTEDIYIEREHARIVFFYMQPQKFLKL